MLYLLPPTPPDGPNDTRPCQSHLCIQTEGGGPCAVRTGHAEGTNFPASTVPSSAESSICPSSPPLGLDGSIGWGQWSHCASSLLSDLVRILSLSTVSSLGQLSAAHEHPCLIPQADLTKRGAAVDTSVTSPVRTLWVAKVSRGLTWNFRPILLACYVYVDIEREWLFWGSQTLPCSSLGSGKNYAPGPQQIPWTIYTGM